VSTPGRTVFITFKGSVNNLMASTRSATALIGQLGTGVVNLGKSLGAALGGNFKPIISTVVGYITMFAKVLLLIPGFLIALVNPLNVAHMAMANFSTAISASTPAQFVAATRNMAPAMRDAVMAIRLLSPQLKNLYGVIQQGFWLGFTDDINNLARVYFPIFESGLGSIGSVLGSLRHSLMEFFLQPQVIEAIKGWMTAFAGLGAPILNMITSLLPTMISLFNSFASILTNFVVPAIVTVAGWFAKIMAWIAPLLSGISSVLGGVPGGTTGGTTTGGGGIGGIFGGIITGIAGFIGHLFGRAGGGSVLGGQSYLVGERGPEILSMGGASGMITPNAGGGSTYITVKIGETELRGMVTEEIHKMVQDVALSARSGRGVIN
jgi:phage-related protein